VTLLAILPAEPPVADSQNLMLPEFDLPALVEAAQNGDRSAFGPLFQKFAPALHGILLARLNRAEADDLVQDAFLTAMNQIGSLRDPAKFGAWILAIARNRSNDHLRRQKKSVELPPDIQVNENVTARAEAERVMQLIRELPEAYRETLTLRLVEGMTGPEIAAVTGLMPGSVRVNLHRGMKALKERLEGSSVHARSAE
jgi:RNA polymerase sigma-70 factor, ECF subfamily